METKDSKKILEVEYNEIMKIFHYSYSPFLQSPQLRDKNDFIVKFSLYEETPNTITSTETSINL